MKEFFRILKESDKLGYKLSAIAFAVSVLPVDVGPVNNAVAKGLFDVGSNLNTNDCVNLRNVSIAYG